jgi:dynein light chain LC8-type
MTEEIKEWSHMWGAKIKMPCDLPDDVLRDAIDTSNAVLEKEVWFAE